MDKYRVVESVKVLSLFYYDKTIVSCDDLASLFP